MRARLVLAVLAVLALGAALDGTVHRFWVGSQTGGQERSDAARAEGVEPDRTLATLTGRVGESDETVGRHSLYLTMRRTVAGADVVIEASAPGVVDLYVRTIGAAADARRVDLTGSVVGPAVEQAFGELGPPDERGSFRGGAWTLRVADGPVARVVMLSRDGATQVVDARLLGDVADLIPGWAGAASGLPVAAQDATSARSAEDPPSWLRASLLETSIFALLLLIGGALLPRSVLPASLRTVLALVVGIGLQGAVGLMLPHGWYGPLLVGVTGIIAVVVARRRATPVGWGRGEWPVLVAAVGGIAVVVGWARWFEFLSLTADSIVYWAGGAVLADGAFGPELVELKRGVTQQSLHAVGFLLGIEGLLGLGAIILVAAAALLTAGAWNGVRDRGRSTVVASVGFVGITLVASPQIRVLAAYLNSHFLIALILAALVVLLGVRGAEQRQAALPAITILIAAVVASRAEGSLLIGLLLLGTLTLDEKRLPWPRAWFALGITTAWWAGLVALGGVMRGEGLPPAILPLVASAVVALAVPAVLGRLSGRVRRAVPLLAGAALWTAVVAVALRAGEDLEFFSVASVNLGQGAGGWGVGGILLMLLGVVTVAVSTGPRDVSGRWLLIGFVPVAMFVKLGDGLQRADADWATLLSGGGRVGWGDSVNRMWTHAMLVVLLLLIRRVTDDEQRAPLTSPSRVAGRGQLAARSVMLLVVAGAIAAQWQPDHLPRSTGVPTTVHEADWGPTIGELIDGASVRETRVVADVALPDGTTPAQVCANLRFVTFGRSNSGSVELSLTLAETSARRIIAADTLTDWGRADVCLDLDPASPTLPGPFEPITVEVRGIDGPLGASVGVLEGIGDGTTIAELPDVRGVVAPRVIGPLAMEITIVSDPPTAVISRAIDRVALLLPWVLLLLGAAVVVEERNSARSLAAQRTSVTVI